MREENSAFEFVSPHLPFCLHALYVCMYSWHGAKLVIRTTSKAKWMNQRPIISIHMVILDFSCYEVSSFCSVFVLVSFRRCILYQIVDDLGYSSGLRCPRPSKRPSLYGPLKAAPHLCFLYRVWELKSRLVSCVSAIYCFRVGVFLDNRAMKSRNTRWVGHVALMVQIRNAYTLWLKTRHYMGDIGTYEGILLKWIVRKYMWGCGLDSAGSE